MGRCEPPNRGNESLRLRDAASLQKKAGAIPDGKKCRPLWLQWMEVYEPDAWKRRYYIPNESDPDMVATLNQVVIDLKSRLLPKLLPLKIFTDFEVHVVGNIQHLGKYVNGSFRRPVVLVTLAGIKQSCDKYDVDYETGIETTITHELGHAIQQGLGLPPNEDQAEQFAYQWHYSGQVISFT